MKRNNRKEEDLVFIKKYPIIFKKFHPIKKIAKGAFSNIYYGVNVHTKEKVAIKTESRYIVNKLLESECFLLFSLKSIGIPKVLSFGHNKEYDILIMPLLGKSLLDLFISRNSNFEFKDICLISIQIIDRIRWVHSQKIIHRDIKPDNFLVGLDDPNIIYLIDFGLSKKYKSSATGKHIKYADLKKFTGTIRYASINALKCKEQSRRDDLESIGYMLIYLMKGFLPWQSIKVKNKKENLLKLSQIKKNIKPEKLCENLPPEMVDYIKYVRNLQFEDNPDYNYLKNLFYVMLKKKGYDPDKTYFSWINENNIKYLKKPVNLSKRSSCSRERIYTKIRKSLDVKRSLSDNKNIWSDYNNNIKIKDYLDEKTMNNIKTDLSHAYENNENNPVNYVNNSINNNFITISVSISNNNTNYAQKNDTKNFLLNSISSLKKSNNHIVPLSQKPSTNSINIKNEFNKKNVYYETSNNNDFNYNYNYNLYKNDNSPKISPVRDKNENKPLAEVPETNSNNILNNKKLKNRNKNINDNNNYNQINTCNSYNKKFSSVNNLNYDKFQNLNKEKKNYFSNNNSNAQKTFKINCNLVSNNLINNNIKNNNNIIYNNTNININNNIRKINTRKNPNIRNINTNVNINYNNSNNNFSTSNFNSNINNNIHSNSNNNIRILNNNFYKSKNLSSNNLKEAKNNLISARNHNQKEHSKIEKKFKYLYQKNIKIKLFNISPFKRSHNNVVQKAKTNCQTFINNSEIMNEIKKFNERYNNKITFGNKNSIKNKPKRLIHTKMTQNNQSADHNKLTNLKNRINRHKYQPHNRDNNCSIF